MSICESEENRRKLAWLVPGYILLAWFFCVLFQPLSIRSSASSPAGIHHSNFVSTSADKNYRVVYLNPDGRGAGDVCRGNGSVITLRPGSASAAVVRLAPSGWYNYRPFNCSVRVEAGEGLDGVSAVVQEMDLREHEDDVRQPGGHWGSSVCLDYIEVYTESSRVRSKLCGEWSVGPQDRLTSHGPRQTLVGYCHDDRSGHSCEAPNIYLNVVLDSAWHRRLADKHGLNLRRRKGFSIVFTGYRHPSREETPKTNESEAEEHQDKDEVLVCGEEEFSCPVLDYSVHSGRPHCIWDRLRCDSRQNCGFLRNEDEEGCVQGRHGAGGTVGGVGGPGGVHTWSISTMTLLIIVYLAIVLVLVLVTMVLLRWHKTLRTPLDVLAESRGLDSVGAATTAVATEADGASSEGGRRTLSIIVAYRPQPHLLMSSAAAAAAAADDASSTSASAAVAKRTTEEPPSYDSLFLEENPPNYGMLTATVNLPREEEAGPAPDSQVIQIETVVHEGEGGEVEPEVGDAGGAVAVAPELSSLVADPSDSAAPPVVAVANDTERVEGVQPQPQCAVFSNSEEE